MTDIVRLSRASDKRMQDTRKIVEQAQRELSALTAYGVEKTLKTVQAAYDKAERANLSNAEWLEFRTLSDRYVSNMRGVLSQADAQFRDALYDSRIEQRRQLKG